MALIDQGSPSLAPLISSIFHSVPSRTKSYFTTWSAGLRDVSPLRQRSAILKRPCRSLRDRDNRA
jgi:hypothetical protein